MGSSYLDELAWRLTRRDTPLDLPDEMSFVWNVIGSSERQQMQNMVNSWYDPKDLFPFIRKPKTRGDHETKRVECPLGGECSLKSQATDLF